MPRKKKKMYQAEHKHARLGQNTGGLECLIVFRKFGLLLLLLCQVSQFNGEDQVFLQRLKHKKHKLTLKPPGHKLHIYNLFWPLKSHGVLLHDCKRMIY